LVLIGDGQAKKCAYNNGSGQPACNEKEYVRLWRNNWDPTRYWKCKGLNQAAVAVHCADNTAFSDKKQCCVVWQEWTWTTPCDPPSVSELKRKV
jgi:hypothetical protein